MSLAAAIAAGATHVLKDGTPMRLGAANQWLCWSDEKWVAVQFAVPPADAILSLVPRDEALQSIATDGKYYEVLKPFVHLMQRELHANSGKGDRPGWLKVDSKDGLLEIFYHVGKLQKALKNHDLPGTVEYAADVANLCMMLLDQLGVLVPKMVEYNLGDGPVWSCRDCGSLSPEKCKSAVQGDCGGGYELARTEPEVVPPTDIKVDTYRHSTHSLTNSNPGCVRVTHIPTGISADSEEERGQYQNRVKAMDRLLVKLNRHALVYDKADQHIPCPKDGRRPGRVAFYDELSQSWQWRGPEHIDYSWALAQAELYWDVDTREWKAICTRYVMGELHG